MILINNVIPVEILSYGFFNVQNDKNHFYPFRHLWVNANDFSTFVAVVGEHILVALDAVREILPEDIPCFKIYTFIICY